MITKEELEKELRYRLDEIADSDKTLTMDNVAKTLLRKGEFIGVLHMAYRTELLNDDEYFEYVKKLGMKGNENDDGRCF